MITILSEIWTPQTINKFNKAYNSYLFFHEDITNSNQYEQESLDCLLFFSNGLIYGNHYLYEDIKSARKNHKIQWANYSQPGKKLSKKSLCDRDINFIYVCLLPFLDNQSIINIKNGDY